MQVASATRCNRALDGETSQLVTECNGVGLGLQHTRSHALVNMTGHLLEGRLEQPELHTRGH